MNSRVIAIGGIVLVAGVAGCSAPAKALGTHTAQVMINGADIGAERPVRCTQTGWAWSISTPADEESGFSAAISTGPQLAAHSVQIRDLGGFTGGFWEGTVGEGHASIDGDTFTISGTAKGSFAHNPTAGADATFEIRTNC